MQELDKEDTLVMLSLGASASGAIAAFALSQMEKIQTWMIQMKIVVTENVIAPWPGFDGAGLDLLRLIILASVVALAVLLVKSVIKQMHMARAIRTARKLEKEEAKSLAVAERRLRRKSSPSAVRMDRTQHNIERD